jgi:adhesin transport system membrane fusion protein
MKEPSEKKPIDEEFISDIKSAVLNKATPLANAILYTVIALIVIGLIWAYFAEIDQKTVANGKVIPYSQGDVIQSLDGGIIKKILVTEGTIVEEGQILAILDDTRYKADYLNGYAKYQALSAMVARLYAETTKSETIDFPELVIK